MKHIGGMRSYPRQLMIGDESWDVRFVRSPIADRTGDQDYLGWCDEANSTIWILMGQSKEETFTTFVHEVIHCLESEGDFQLPHALVYKLEKWLARFLVDNCSAINNIVCGAKSA